jgi:endonuclease/exonuclease/phosphatase (EEP) superfamily protein YafD
LWRALALLDLLLVATLIMGLEVHAPDTGSQPLRLMTYNAKTSLALRRPGGMHGLMHEIRQHNPDLLVLQDAGEVADLSWPEAFEWGWVMGRREVHVFGQYVVASRRPLRDCQRRTLAPAEAGGSYVHCVLTDHGTEVDLYTVHLLSPRDGLNAARWRWLEGVPAWKYNVATRLAQAEALARVVAESRRPVIVAGDLNAPQSSMVIQALQGTGLRDAFASSGRGYGYTYGHDLRPGVSFLRIDHVLVSPTIGVARCVAGDRQGSEHRPVIADLLLQRH